MMTSTELTATEKAERQLRLVPESLPRSVARQMLPPYVEYSPRFVEEAVSQKVVGDREETEYHAARGRAFAIEDASERASELRRIDRAWFNRLGLDQPLNLALAEVGVSRKLAPRVVVASPWTEKDEGIGLFVVPADETAFDKPARSILVLLRPERLAVSADLVTYLHQELARVARVLAPEPPARGDEQASASARRSLSESVVGRFLSRWR